MENLTLLGGAGLGLLDESSTLDELTVDVDGGPSSSTIIGLGRAGRRTSESKGERQETRNILYPQEH